MYAGITAIVSVSLYIYMTNYDRQASVGQLFHTHTQLNMENLPQIVSVTVTQLSHLTRKPLLVLLSPKQVRSVLRKSPY